MKVSNFLKYKLNREKVTFFLFSLLLIFPLLPITYLGFSGVFISALLIVINYKNKTDKTPYLKPVVLSVLFYFILIISLLYSQNISLGLKEIGKTLLLAVFPLSIICYSKFNKEKIDLLLKIFIIVNILLCFYIFFIAVEILSYKKMIFLREVNLFDQIKTFVTTPYNVPFNWSSRDFKIHLFFHKAYISLSLCLSGIMTLFLLFNRNYKKYNIFIKILLLISVVLIAYFLFYMQSLPNLISFLLGSIIVSVHFFMKRIKLLLVLLTLVIGILGYYSNGLINVTEKIIIQVENDFRKDIWKCGWEVSKNDLLMGIGIGDQEDSMLNCYKNNSGVKYKQALEQKMNSHNQYLSFIVSGGLLCLLSFLYLLFSNFKLAFANNDILFLAFIVLIAINFLFENILDRVYGVFFFGFFNSLFIKRNSINYNL